MSQRIIRPDAHLIQEFTYQQEQQLPVDKPVVQYIRQSTMGQVKHNLQSKIQQDAQLAQRLIARGFSDIIKIEADQGKSGQKRRDERTGLDHLYTLAEQGKVGAIAFFDASRLWRDQTHVWYNDFIQLVIKHTIPVITYSRV